MTGCNETGKRNHNSAHKNMIFVLELKYKAQKGLNDVKCSRVLQRINHYWSVPGLRTLQIIFGTFVTCVIKRGEMYGSLKFQNYFPEEAWSILELIGRMVTRAVLFKTLIAHIFEFMAAIRPSGEKYFAAIFCAVISS